MNHGKISVCDENFPSPLTALVPVTEWMIDECESFVILLAKEIFLKLDKKSLLVADNVIGVSGGTSSLACAVMRLINEHRRKHAIKKVCTVLSFEFLDSKYFSRTQTVSSFLRGLLGMKRKVIFVHCLFDHPKKHHNKAPWKYTKEALEHWNASEEVKNEKVVKQLAGDMGGRICCSVIMLIPRRQYAAFMNKDDRNGM